MNTFLSCIRENGNNKGRRQNKQHYCSTFKNHTVQNRAVQKNQYTQHYACDHETHCNKATGFLPVDLLYDQIKTYSEENDSSGRCGDKGCDRLDYGTDAPGSKQIIQAASTDNQTQNNSDQCGRGKEVVDNSLALLIFNYYVIFVLFRYSIGDTECIRRKTCEK